MTAARLRVIAAHEARTQLRSPLFWLLLVFLGFLTSAINPTAMLPSGSAAVSGVVPAVNSAHALAQSLTLTAFFGFPFLAALLAGLAVIRDDEAEVGDLLHSTALTPAEYVTGKVLGSSVMLGLAILAQVLMAMALHEGLLGGGATTRGAFAPWHYAGPALLLVAPGAWFVTATALAVGLRFRRPMAVYAVPTALFTLTLAFTWEWAPPGLAPWLDHLLMIVDPTGLRWLGRVAFAVDRGAAFYNTAPLPLDATLLAGRVVTVALPTLALLGALRHFRRSLSGAPGGARRAVRATVPVPVPVPPASVVLPPPLLRMTARAPGMIAAARVVAAAEVRHLLRSPAIYLYSLFLMSVVLEVGVSGTDPYGATVRLTAGTLAVRAIPVVTLLVCLFLLFTVVESLHREVTARFDPLLYTTPVPTGAILLGKATASAVVIGILTMACIVASAGLLALQDGGGPALGPLLLVYGVVLGPTFIVWTCFVGAVMALVRQRAAALGIGLAALVLTGVDLLGGSMTWVTNWPLWGALRWSDLGVFPLNGPALWLNRGLALAVAAGLGALTLVVFRRREPDPARRRARWHDGTVGRAALRLAPFALLPLLVGSLLGIEVRDGFQGGPARAAAEQYHAANTRPGQPWPRPSWSRWRRSSSSSPRGGAWRWRAPTCSGKAPGRRRAWCRSP
ncbi:MAG: ABC transporter permease subunit [Gemmatimonadetes bacterium]|nr:ABC transporter permease subunit [Gemmatimonadota bacterium]